MKSKKKNEMEKAQNTMGAAQELDMDDLENVAGGRVVERIVEEQRHGPIFDRHRRQTYDGDYTVYLKNYDVVDETNGNVVKNFNNKKEAEDYDNVWHHRI